MTTLARIKKKIRRLTATPSENQLSNVDLEEYIDDFYQQDMPAELKLWNLHEKFTFFTEADEDRYILPVNTFFNAQPPAYIAGYQSFWSQSREQFFRLYPRLQFDEDVGSGDGTTGPFTFTLTNRPVLKDDFSVSAVDTADITHTLEDDGAGNLRTPGTTVSLGTINYITGAVSVTQFATPAPAIPGTSTINAQSVPYEADRPTAILFFSDEFILRPVPDKSYRVEVETYRTPSQLLNNNTDSPDLDQWWQFIAFGAALKVLEDRRDTDSYQKIYPMYDDQKQKVLHRTIQQQTSERTATIFTEQIQFPIGSFNNRF